MSFRLNLSRGQGIYMGREQFPFTLCLEGFTKAYTFALDGNDQPLMVGSCIREFWLYNYLNIYIIKNFGFAFLVAFTVGGGERGCLSLIFFHRFPPVPPCGNCPRNWANSTGIYIFILNGWGEWRNDPPSSADVDLDVLNGIEKVPSTSYTSNRCIFILYSIFNA